MYPRPAPLAAVRHILPRRLRGEGRHRASARVRSDHRSEIVHRHRIGQSWTSPVSTRLQLQRAEERRGPDPGGQRLAGAVPCVGETVCEVWIRGLFADGDSVHTDVADQPPCVLVRAAVPVYVPGALPRGGTTTHDCPRDGPTTVARPNYVVPAEREC